VDGGTEEGARAHILIGNPQQRRLVIEQDPRRLRARRPGHEIRHAPPGIADVARLSAIA
jgi:hypothetical protein